jgi:hypothetical protein
MSILVYLPSAPLQITQNHYSMTKNGSSLRLRQIALAYLFSFLISMGFDTQKGAGPGVIGVDQNKKRHDRLFLGTFLHYIGLSSYLHYK